MGWISDLISPKRGEASPPRWQSAAAAAPREEAPDAREVRIATAVLLLEVSQADHEVDDRERRAAAQALQSAFGLSAEETSGVLAEADRRSAESVSLYEFARAVDRSFSAAQKATVIELLFQVAFADATLAGEEEHLIRKAASLLHVSHSAFIAAKARARATMEAAAGSPASG